MKIQTVLIIAATAIISACNNDDDGDIIPEQPAEEMPSYFTGTPGSYWVYDTYLVEASGDEVLSFQNDTVLALGDTVIGGNTYQGFSRNAILGLPNPADFYLRDSSGYIVGPTGLIKMSYVNFEDVLFFREYGPDSDSTKLIHFHQMERSEGDVVLPAGTFSDVLNRKSTHLIVQNGDTTDLYVSNNLYAPEIGQITSVSFGGGEIFDDQVYHEQRLVDYHIEAP